MNIFKKIFGGARDSDPSQPPLQKLNQVESVKDPKILLCSIKDDDIDAALQAQDRTIYQDDYKSISEHQAADVTDFFSLIQNKPFDIVHLFVKLEPGGTIEDNQLHR